MKKNLLRGLSVALLVPTFIGYAYAYTGSWGPTGNDVIRTVTPIETVYGWDGTAYVTYTDVPGYPGYAPASQTAYPFTFSGSVDASANISNPGGLLGFGTGCGPVGGYQSNRTINQDTPASGSVSFTVCVRSMGSPTIWPGESYVGHVPWAFSAPVANAASVNLNITQRIEQKVDKFLALLNIDHASAQTGVIASTSPKITVIVVANVNLTDTKLIKVSDDNYNVSFVLTNNSEKQEGVQYKFSFINDQEEVVSTQTHPANLTLEKNTPVFINEKLQLPQGLHGTYIVRVQAMTSTGLPLGSGIAGQIILNGKDTPHLSSCTTNRKGYEQSEILPVTCSVVAMKSLASYENEGNGYIVATRAFYGNEPVEKVKALAEIVNGKATTRLQGLTTPGTYRLVSQVIDRSGVPSGNEVTEIFVVKGTSVSILNLILDKDFYATRDTAKGTVAFSVFNTDQNKRLSLVANLRGQRDDCASEIRQELSRRSAVELSFPVTSRCVNPSLSVKVMDEKGFVFAEKTLSLTTKNAPLSSEAKTLLAVIGFAILFYVVRHERVLVLVKKSMGKKGKK